MSPMRDGRTTSEDSATQLLICEPLSFAIKKAIKRTPVPRACESHVFIFVHEKILKMSWVIFLLEHCGKKDPLSDTNHILLTRRSLLWVLLNNLFFDWWDLPLPNLLSRTLSSYLSITHFHPFPRIKIDRWSVTEMCHFFPSPRTIFHRKRKRQCFEWRLSGEYWSDT